MEEKCKGANTFIVFAMEPDICLLLCNGWTNTHSEKSRGWFRNPERQNWPEASCKCCHSSDGMPLNINLNWQLLPRRKKGKKRHREIVTLTVLLYKLTKWVYHKKQPQIKAFVCSKQNQWNSRISLEKLWEVNINV